MDKKKSNLAGPTPPQTENRALSKKELVNLLLTDVDKFNAQRPSGKIDLRGIVIKTDINDADLSDADLTGSEIRADARNVNFTRANLTACTIYRHAGDRLYSFNASNFSNAIFDEIAVDLDISFCGCIFTGSNAVSQDFFKDRMVEKNFRGCQW